MNDIAIRIAETLSGKKVNDLTSTEDSIAWILFPLYLEVKGRGKNKKLATTDFTKNQRKHIWDDTVAALGR